MALTVRIHKGGGENVDISENVQFQAGADKYKSLHGAIEKMKSTINQELTVVVERDKALQSQSNQSNGSASKKPADEDEGIDEGEEDDEEKDAEPQKKKSKS